jgi:hypothetical protein
MIFYDVITHAYANEVSARNDFPDCAHCRPKWNGNNRPQKRGMVVSYVSGSVHHAIQQLSPCDRLHCIHQGLHVSPKTVVHRSEVRRSRWLSNRILPPNPTVLKMFIEKCSYLPARIRGCAILLQPQLSLDMERNILQHWQLIFQETEVALRCQAFFKYKRPDELVSSHTALNVNRKTAVRPCVRIIDRPDVWIPWICDSVLNVASSVNKMFVWSCCFPEASGKTLHVHCNQLVAEPELFARETPWRVLHTGIRLTPTRSDILRTLIFDCAQPFRVLTVRELRSSGWYVGWCVTSCCAIEKELHTVVKNFMLLSILKKLPYNSFILQTPISSSCMFSRWTIKHPLLLPTLPRSVGLSSPTSPV